MSCVSVLELAFWQDHVPCIYGTEFNLPPYLKNDILLHYLTTRSSLSFNMECTSMACSLASSAAVSCCFSSFFSVLEEHNVIMKMQSEYEIL